MKVNKTVSLRVDVAQQLHQEDNQSRIVETLLRNHYDMETVNNE